MDCKNFLLMLAASVFVIAPILHAASGGKGGHGGTSGGNGGNGGDSK